mmetsp:Transcript_86356/g.231282  ORF Transcript_86356/g.231282 Transcript_86356/m.231282 type:complete len:244 (-) Transcript_86356:155-886(-)
MSTTKVASIVRRVAVCSSREANQFIYAGHVLVNGAVATHPTQEVPVDADIQLSDRAKNIQAQKISIILNKPLHYSTVASTDARADQNAKKLLNAASRDGSCKTKHDPKQLRRLFVAGHLDRAATGLVVFSQDGAVSRRVRGGDEPVEYEYHVKVAGNVSEGVLSIMREGLCMDGTELAPCQVEEIAEGQLKFVMLEQRKRQLQRMCELVGLRVNAIHRARIGRLGLGSLAMGKWRVLLPHEEI